MLKNISNLGKALNKAEQKLVNGGVDPISGPGGGGNGDNNDPMPCYCYNRGRYTQVPCNSTCPDGTAPLCP